jgi:predicted flap endonuclease-1-like 5' DNA nuclease
MNFVHEYWWLIAIVAVLVLLLLLLRPRQRVTLSDSGPARPHMAYSKRPPEGRGVGGEAAAATSDVTGQILRAAVHRNLDRLAEDGDDLCRLKGVGPKFADVLHALGFFRFEQIAGLGPNEIERLDDQLGAFRGRITRDRIVDQAEYLARNDIDGFEQKFGKL